MQFKEYFFMALKDLKRRKGRTCLTSLGITIGTLLIVTMISLGMALENFVMSSVNKEENVKSVEMKPYSYSMKEAKEVESVEDYFKKIDDKTLEDIQNIGNIDSIIAKIDTSIQTLEVNGQKFKGDVDLKGYNINQTIFPESYITSVRSVKENDSIEPIKYGRTIESDLGEALLGEKLLEDLGFNVDEVLDKEISIAIINNDSFLNEKKLKIVGIIDENFQESNCIISSHKEVADIKGLRRMKKDYLENKGYDRVNIIAKDISQVESITEKIKNLGYYYNSTVETAKSVEERFNAIKLIITSLGIVVIIVASIGIVNTMTMCVYERKKNIGVMKSVGANRNSIRAIFLVQSCTIGILGGIVGLIFSVGLNSLSELIINNIALKDTVSRGIIVSISLTTVIGIFIFIIGITLISGLYPANKASKMDPIEALRG